MTTMKQMQAAAKWDSGFAKPESEPPVAGSATGSAAVSADAWANIGRDAMQKAQAAVADGKFGTADGHRKNAEMAFGFELKLRQPPNAPHELPATKTL